MTEAVAAEAKGAVSSKEVPQLIRQSYEEVRKFADELRKKGLLTFHKGRKGGLELEEKDWEYYDWSTNPQRRTTPKGHSVDDYAFMREHAEGGPYDHDNAGHMMVSDNGRDIFVEFETVHREGPKDKQGRRLAIYGVLKPNSVRKEWFHLRPGEITYDVSLDSPVFPEKGHVFTKLRKGSLFKKGTGTNAQAQLVHDRLLDVLRWAAPPRRP